MTKYKRHSKNNSIGTGIEGFEFLTDFNSLHCLRMFNTRYRHYHIFNLISPPVTVSITGTEGATNEYMFV